MKELEKIFWNGDNYINKKRIKINPIPLEEPYSLVIGSGNDEYKYKKIKEYFNKCIPKTSNLYLNANAYCIGTKHNNDCGNPIQFYKILEELKK